MNIKILAMNILVPILAIIAIAAILGRFKVKEKESIKGELYQRFISDWNEGEKEIKPGEEGSFFQRFLKFFTQTYEYEKYKEYSSKSKYNFLKLLVLFIILCIPFLALFMVSGKEEILNENEWNNIYLYTLILIPLIFAYLVNKYIRINQYHQTWHRHMQNRHQMEWRMMLFVKDYEMFKDGVKTEDSPATVESLKAAFVNDMCDYWKVVTTEIANSNESKEENIFEDISKLFGGSKG